MSGLMTDAEIFFLKQTKLNLFDSAREMSDSNTNNAGKNSESTKRLPPAMGAYQAYKRRYPRK